MSYQNAEERIRQTVMNKCIRTVTAGRTAVEMNFLRRRRKRTNKRMARINWLKEWAKKKGRTTPSTFAWYHHAGG